MVHMDSEIKESKSKSEYATAATTPAPTTTTTTSTTTSTTQAHDINNIILYPFAHQVGGHTQLLTLDKSTLCKPLIPRELLFYLNVPDELVKFVPAYKGVVQIRESSTGTYPPVVYQPLRSPKCPYAKYGPGSSCTLPARFGGNRMIMNHQQQQQQQSRASSNIRQPRGFNIEKSNVQVDSSTGASEKLTRSDLLVKIAGQTDGRQLEPFISDDNALITTDDATTIDPAVRQLRGGSEDDSNASSDHTNNSGYFSEDSSQSLADMCGSPLELKVQIRQCSDEKILKKNLSQDNLLQADYISRPNEKYLLLLENVASKYQLPCILDLKMGTRQHGDDATEEKRHRQIAKCQASTSASLGVRLCGMQVYQVDYGGFLWYDKYYGRKMDEEGLKSALYKYFHNGFQLNEDMIDDVIARLKLLSNAVERSPSFRFYGTSLLIIHEGCTSRSLKRCPVDVRLIDFAHTICDYNYDSTTKARSNISSSSSILKCASAEQLTTTPSSLLTSPVVTKPNSIAQQPPSTLQPPQPNSEIPHRNQKQQVDHEAVVSPSSAAHPNQGGNIIINHNNDDVDNNDGPTTRKISKTCMGPDKGLLFGLDNLMRLLDDLKSQYHSQDKRQPIIYPPSILIPNVVSMQI